MCVIGKKEDSVYGITRWFSKRILSMFRHNFSLTERSIQQMLQWIEKFMFFPSLQSHCLIKCIFSTSSCVLIAHFPFNGFTYLDTTNFHLVLTMSQQQIKLTSSQGTQKRFDFFVFLTMSQQQMKLTSSQGTQKRFDFFINYSAKHKE